MTTVWTADGQTTTGWTTDQVADTAIHFFVLFGASVGTNLIHDFTAVTFSVKLAFFREKRPFL